MEDQRNWTDASYKTYSRPLALPWPYTLAKGDQVKQAVQLDLSGSATQAKSQDECVHITIGDIIGPTPAVGAGLQVDDAATVREHSAQLSSVGLSHVTAYYNPNQGHDTETLCEFI